ncbi:phytanoyl-CoA dioxygenase family protein [Actinopolymorpha sp. NPDC004070]|uniref:phytanoyl-CoA dioxygenase family protein n=1 Tax=Actinopolymorpha sp. NPDC004070 TaxID=3154548 RepID=UPI0033BE0646
MTSPTQTATAQWPRLFSRGRELDGSPTSLGRLRESTDVRGDPAALRDRMSEDGYLFLPGFFDPAAVADARRSVTDRLHEEGLTDPAFPADLAVAPADSSLAFKPDLAHDNPALHQLLYGRYLLGFYESLLGGPVRHYDFTWMRAVAPGRGTAPHGDVVFMGRGTHHVYTAWVPLGDADFEQGGLMVLEGSHQRPEILDDYALRDVDTYCTNAGPAAKDEPRWNGSLSDDPVEVRERLGGRWLTAQFRAGDLLTFSIYLVHASLDNHSNRIRLSSDSRYQLASEPVDERWIGEAPVGHGPEAKRGLIC